MNEKPSILESSAMVRILFEVVGLPKKGNFPAKSQIKVKKVDVFPLAFAYSEDFAKSSYELINDAIHADAKRVGDFIPTTDPGIYEMVGEFYGKFSLNEQLEVLNQIWEVSDHRTYQLTEEEVRLLPAPLRASFENKL